jgi:putative membrane protein
VLFVLTALIMWIPVCGPWPDLRLSLPGQMVYLFLQSVVPTLPAAWLANSETVVYSSYDQPIRLWGITALDDQIASGLVMKLVEVAYLWAIIIMLFFRWASRHQEADRHGLNLTERQILEWEGGDQGALSASPVSEPTTDRPEI